MLAGTVYALIRRLAQLSLAALQFTLWCILDLGCELSKKRAHSLAIVLMHAEGGVTGSQGGASQGSGQDAASGRQRRDSSPAQLAFPDQLAVSTQVPPAFACNLVDPGVLKHAV